IFLIFSFLSCRSPQKLFSSWYPQNEKKLASVEEQYHSLYPKRPFSIEFKNKTFDHLALEIASDTLRHIYSFYLNEPFLADTLAAYQFDTNAVILLLNNMQSSKCTWINMLDYYDKR